jgi:hypothetical protein
MTLAQIRTAVRNFINEQSTETGAMFPSDNVMLDFFINQATEMVTLDLVEFLSEDFLEYEIIDLKAGVDKYNLNHEWLRIVAINRNQSGESTRIIPYFDTLDELMVQTKGETGEPRGWTRKGEWIYFMPVPTGDIDGFAKAWITTPEQVSMGTLGPQKLPRLAHRLVPLAATVIICHQQESKAATRWEKLYTVALESVKKVYGYRIQQQPRFLRPSIDAVIAVDARDPTLYDLDPFFR